MKIHHQFLTITLCAAAIGLLVGLPAYLMKGTEAILATAITAGACWSGAASAILSINIFRRTLKKELPWFIIGGIFRMGVPFTVALVVVMTQEKDFGTLVLILFPIVYLLMLPVDAFIMLPGNNSSKDEFVRDIPNNS